MRTAGAVLVVGLLLTGCSGKSDDKVTVTGSVQTQPGVDGTAQPVGGTVLVTGVSTATALRQSISPGQAFRFQMVPATYLFTIEGTPTPCAPVTVNVTKIQPPITITCRGI